MFVIADSQQQNLITLKQLLLEPCVLQGQLLAHRLLLVIIVGVHDGKPSHEKRARVDGFSVTQQWIFAD
jgi:hypothetical protein